MLIRNGAGNGDGGSLSFRGVAGLQAELARGSKVVSPSNGANEADVALAVVSESGEAETETERSALWVGARPDDRSSQHRRRLARARTCLLLAGLAVLMGSVGAAVGYLIGGGVGRPSRTGRDSQARLSTARVTGAHVWQMFRGGGDCPWTSTPEADADCAHRRKLNRHILDSVLTCGNQQPLATIMQTRRDVEETSSVFARNGRSLAHRGAPLLVPEHSLLGYELAAEMGAGFIECDVSVTKDMTLVCRHSNCDLALTTDILGGRHPDLAARCAKPFSPAASLNTDASAYASATCCTYDFTFAELSRLCLTMEATPNRSALEPSAFAGPTPPWRGGPSQLGGCQRLMSFEKYLEWLLPRGLGAIPELKDTTDPDLVAFLASVNSSPTQLADIFVEKLRDAGFSQSLVRRDGGDGGWAWESPHEPKAIMQTFDRKVAEYWKSGEQATPPVAFLYGAADGNETECTAADCGSPEVISRLASVGVEMMAPPLWRLVGSKGHRMAATRHAAFLNDLNVGIVGWSLDRSGCEGGEPGLLARAGPCGWYWTGLEGAAAFDFADIGALMYTLYHEANATAAFADYPAINTVFLNCVPPMAASSHSGEP